jgi:hypothetical protein
MVDWTKLTKEELLHLVTGDLEVESLILVHLVGNVKSQREMGSMKCYTCEGIIKKFAMPVTGAEITKLESLRLIRWLLRQLSDPDDSLERAQGLLDIYKKRE